MHSNLQIIKENTTDPFEIDEEPSSANSLKEYEK